MKNAGRLAWGAVVILVFSVLVILFRPLALLLRGAGENEDRWNDDS